MPAVGGECSIGGQFQFLSFNTPGDSGAHPHSVIITRPGLDGGEVWRTTLQPTTFVLQSVVDVANRDAAYQAHHDYIQSHYDLDLQAIIWKGTDIGAIYKVGYFVEDVRIVEVLEVACFVGGLNPPSRAFLICDWVITGFKIFVPPPAPLFIIP